MEHESSDSTGDFHDFPIFPGDTKCDFDSPEGYAVAPGKTGLFNAAVPRKTDV